MTGLQIMTKLWYFTKSVYLWTCDKILLYTWLLAIIM